jgi:protein disulfide-isomerase A6
MPIEYANKMRSKTDDERKAAIERLDKMKGGSMKPELKLWIFQRLHILNGLQGLSAKDEL